MNTESDTWKTKSPRDQKVTVVIPSYNQASFLEAAIRSVIDQQIDTEIIVVDGGSTDHSKQIIKKYDSHILWWRSCHDTGQAAAVNEGVQKGTASYVCWLNSDDLLLPGALMKLTNALDNDHSAPAVYGKCIVVDKNGKKKRNYWTARFTEKHLANRCFIAQPATLIRRTAWEHVGGLNETLNLSMDYDLWWRLYKHYGKLHYIAETVAATRCHLKTKTNIFRRAHYQESMMVVRKYYGALPIKWYIAWPIRVPLWCYFNKLRNAIGIAQK